jgi:hypothetical protein
MYAYFIPCLVVFTKGCYLLEQRRYQNSSPNLASQNLNHESYITNLLGPLLYIHILIAMSARTHTLSHDSFERLDWTCKSWDLWNHNKHLSSYVWTHRLPLKMALLNYGLNLAKYALNFFLTGMPLKIAMLNYGLIIIEKYKHRCQVEYSNLDGHIFFNIKET